MSRIGYSPIPLPPQVSVEIAGQAITVSGPRGTLQRTIHRRLTVVVQDQVLNVQRDGDDREARAVHGLTRALLNNMVVGVSAGHSRALLVTGIGYRCEQIGTMVRVAAGFSHPVMIRPSEGVELKVETANRILVTGCDKELVGDMAARIRGMRPIRPYIFRGDFQGVRYADETPRRKAGKQGAKR
ncbi:MAG: 50S ribosomal protein L6 [Fimbriimonadaceae bacterium]|nr:50S ribosomal protein L6 [Fimbriimonadaceae bacterium]